MSVSSLQAKAAESLVTPTSKSPANPKHLDSKQIVNIIYN